MSDHPRPELTHDYEALERVALIADYFEGLAIEDGDEAKAEDISIDGEVLRRWAAFIKTVRVDVKTRQMKDGG